MPRQTPDAYWSCVYCGMGGFRSFEQARAHESNECQQRQSRKRQRQLRSYALLDPEAPVPRDMSLSDAVACRSIEVFEAEDSAAAYAGQVGVRCIHCSRDPVPPMSAVFPGSADTLGSSVRMIAERHLQGCSMAPNHVREGAMPSAQRNNQALMDYINDFARRYGIVDRMPYTTGIVFEHPPQQQPTLEETIAATPLSRRSKDNPERLPQQYEEGRYASGFAQQTPQYGGQQQQQQGMYAQEQQGGGVTPAMSTPGHPPQQATPQEAPIEVSPHQGAYGMTPSQPSPYEAQQQQHPPASYPFYQEHNGSWVCKYCVTVHPQYRDPGSVWSTPHHNPPPPNFVDQHMSMCRAFLNFQQQQQPRPTGWGGQPSPHYPPPYQPGMQPHPYGGPPPGWGAGTSTPMHPQGLPPPYPPGPPEQQGMAPYYPPPDASPHPGMIPPAGEGSDRTGGMVPPPTTPRAPPTPSDEAVNAAINHLEAAGRKFDLDPKTTEQLVLDEDKLLLTDYFYYIMKQLRLCRFAEADRKTRGGKRENIIVGYGGLQCVHCAEAPNSRKFFWSNVDRLANSFAEIPSHVLKCRRCPNQTKAALSELKLRHPEQMSKLPRGSQKVFFRRMWRRLHDSDPEPEGEGKPAALSVPSPEESKTSTSSGSKVETAEGNASSPGTSGDDSTVVIQRATEDAAKALAASVQSTAPPSPSSRILLAIAEDKEWLSDMDCFIRKQLEVFCANEDDVHVAQTDRKYPVNLGQVGIRCIHCALNKGAKGNAVAFPYSISGIYESVREFQRLHLESCPNLPKSARVKLAGFKGSASLSSVLRKYYILASKALGMHDTPDGIRSGAESVPLGSSAAFAFSDSTTTSSRSGTVSEQMMSTSSDQPYIKSGPMITPLERRKRKAPPTSAEQASGKKKAEEAAVPEEKDSSS